VVALSLSLALLPLVAAPPLPCPLSLSFFLVVGGMTRILILLTLMLI